MAGGNAEQTAEVAKKFKIPHWTLDLAESLVQPGVAAVFWQRRPRCMRSRLSSACAQASM